jgi:hypothetical protein
MAKKHVMTPARKAALRKAQLASARARRRNRQVTLYHYTTPRRAKKIIVQQQLKPSRNPLAIGNKKGQIYFTRRRSNFYKKAFRPLNKPSAVVTVKVPLKHVQRDPNDAWFLTHDWTKASGYKPANAYMVHKRHLTGRKIKVL